MLKVNLSNVRLATLLFAILLICVLHRKIIIEAKRVWRGKFFPLLKLKTVDSGQYDDELFVQILSIRKGKTLLGRVVPLLSQVRCESK